MIAAASHVRRHAAQLVAGRGRLPRLAEESCLACQGDAEKGSGRSCCVRSRCTGALSQNENPASADFEVFGKGYSKQVIVVGDPTLAARYLMI